MPVIGIIPSVNKTYEVYGDFNTVPLEEGRLYYDPKSKRVYYYSKTLTRSSPESGYFPIWNGSKFFITKASREKYFDKDVKTIDIGTMSQTINRDIASMVIYNQKRSESNAVLRPAFSDSDNMFTQCIKGVLNKNEYTIIDLEEMSSPHLDQKVIENYYSALNKISFMRLDKWHVWIDIILHLNYVLTVYKEEKVLLVYHYPSNVFKTGIVKYDDIIASIDDPFKKIIKILMIMENISKADLRSDEVDDYTVNNMFTTISSNKALSAQLFSRFIRMANLSYTIELFDDKEKIFEYKE